MPIPIAPPTTLLEGFERDRDRVDGILGRVRAEIDSIENGSTLRELQTRKAKLVKMLAVTTERLIMAGGMADMVTSAALQMEFDFTEIPAVPDEPVPVRLEAVPMPQVLVAAGVA